MAKIKSYGVEVTIATNIIGGLTDANLGGSDVAIIDTTTHDGDGWKTSVGGLKDGGTIELSGDYDFDDVGQAYFIANLGAAKAFVVTLSDDSTATFTAIVGKFDLTNPLDEVVKFSASAKVTGAVVYAAAT